MLPRIGGAYINDAYMNNQTRKLKVAGVSFQPSCVSAAYG